MPQKCYPLLIFPKFFFGGGCAPIIDGVLYHNTNFLARLCQVTSYGPPVKELNEYNKSF